MFILEKLINFMLISIRNNVNGMNDEKLEVIYYGLYLFLSDIIKISVILFVAFVQGLFMHVIITLSCLGILRTFAGGIHSKTWLGCFVANCLITFGTVYLAIFLSFIKPILICLLVMPVCFAIIHIYAPSDHENKPVVSIRQRKRLKLTSNIILILEFIIASFLVGQPYSNIIIFTALATSLLMLPIAYKITDNHHGNWK
jgi:accessory gene regulator B